MKFYEKWLAFAAISVFFSGFGSAQAQESEESTEPAFVANFSNLPEAKRTEYLAHRSKAYEYSIQKRTFESLGEIHKATEIFDEDPSLWSLKASCYVEFRIFDKAKKAYERSLALRPKDMGTLFNLAEMDFISSILVHRERIKVLYGLSSFFQQHLFMGLQGQHLFTLRASEKFSDDSLRNVFFLVSILLAHSYVHFSTLPKSE